MVNSGIIEKRADKRKMRLTIRISMFILFTFTILSAQPTREQFVDGFMKKLVEDPSALVYYADESARQKAERFNIVYTDATSKIVAGDEIPLKLRNLIMKGELELLHKIENLPQNYYRVEVTIPGYNYKKYFYFENFKLVAPSKYLTQYWTKYETEYFDFFVREKKQFNSYSGFQLGRTLGGVMKLLGFTDEEKEMLRKNKLVYIVALNEKNVGEFSGVDGKGAFLPAWDEIITSTPYNVAGLAEQLIRIKLGKMKLHGPKLFENGFAAAIGGISLRSSGLITKLGLFLQKSGMLDVGSLSEDSAFTVNDPSFSYPLAAAYNKFLIDKFGSEGYLRLYIQKNSPNDKLMTGNSVEVVVPLLDEFRKFAEEAEPERNILVEDIKDTLPLLFDSEMVRIYDAGDYYWFHTKGSFSLTETPGINDYMSKLFKEVVPTRSYEGEKYLINVTREDIIIYNLYTDTVIDAHYKFVDKQPVAGVSSLYRFRIKKSLFEEPVTELKVVPFY